MARRKLEPWNTMIKNYNKKSKRGVLIVVYLITEHLSAPTAYDVGKLIGLPKRTVHDYLVELEKAGYVCRIAKTSARSDNIGRPCTVWGINAELDDNDPCFNRRINVTRLVRQKRDYPDSGTSSADEPVT